MLNGSHTPPIYETWLHNKSVSRETFNGLPWRIMTRQHLHNALAKGRMRRRRRNPCSIPEVVAADPSGQITLASGEVLEADLVIGADGVGSKVRDSIGFEQDRWISTDGLIRLIVPRKKKELGYGEWDNTIDMWNFWPRVLDQCVRGAALLRCSIGRHGVAKHPSRPPLRGSGRVR